MMHTATVTEMKGTREIYRQRYEIARFRVTIMRGPDAPRAIDSEGEEMTIGTAMGNDLQLADSAVSRHHCALRVTAGGVELRDLGSTNGTLLHGSRIESAVLAPGTAISIGETVLRFDPLEDTVSEPVSRSDRFGPVLGRSKAMRRLFAICQRVAPSDATVLLEGETGSGKGLLAEAIHENSPRAAGPFVTVDCAAIPPTLMEAELFGHEPGAFTGARGTRIGFFESASGGTVFLDELGELPLELQPKLLRVLEKREIRRVGSHHPIPVDVRIVAATNRDLRREVNRGAFRSDLWYRLNTVRMIVPPLRERPEDIPLLVQHFYRQASPDPDANPPSDLIAAMRRQPWRGNVRELASAVERSLIFSNPDKWEEVINPDRDRAPDELDPSLSFRAAKMRATAHWERGYLERLIAQHDGNISQAARAARMDRSHLRDLLRRYKIEIPGRE